MSNKIINPHTGRPMGHQGPPKPPAGGPPPPGGQPGPMPGAMPPPQVNQEQMEAMFRQFHEGKMNNLLNAINNVIAQQQVDFATTVGALTILANVYAQRSITPPDQNQPQPMGPPPPEMTGTARHEPAPEDNTAQMEASGSSEPPEEK